MLKNCSIRSGQQWFMEGSKFNKNCPLVWLFIPLKPSPKRILVPSLSLLFPPAYGIFLWLLKCFWRRKNAQSSQKLRTKVFKTWQKGVQGACEWFHHAFTQHYVSMRCFHEDFLQNRGMIARHYFHYFHYICLLRGYFIILEPKH